MNLPHIRVVTFAQPLQWLRRGWQDMATFGWVSLAHGVVLGLGGLLMTLFAHNQFWWLAGAFSGFLIIAPILAVSLYCLSRSTEGKTHGSWGLVLTTWLSWRSHGSSQDGKDWRLVQFGLLLALAGTGWVLTSASLISWLSPTPIEKPADFLRYVVLAKEGWLFELWLGIGGLLAAPIFASSAIAIPLLLDRRIGLLTAVVTSWEAVLHNPLVMAWWAALVMGLTCFGMLTAMLGLIPVIPVLGHATWHAYRDLVDATGWPERTAPTRRGP